ncbi:putative flavin-binding monooxygenase-like protein [Umbelopsis sp. PMI_123]|nr:putative flavin-binding monooxygenase-like protein [Umbelopsis sp. PMI_123]
MVSKTYQHKPTVGIIGSGFSGICAAVQLKEKLGIKATIIEMEDDIGGTWNVNKYPGCACDVPSHLYSLSFSPNPNWSQNFSSQPEIFAYLQSVGRKYDIYSQTRFKTRAVNATWLDDAQQWKVEVREIKSWDAQGNFEEGPSEYLYFDIVFGAIGPFGVPHFPELYESFKGKIVHTAKWNMSLEEFTGKRVAVVGSGSSGIQVIPKIAPYAKTLISYQRTPAWVMPRQQFRYPQWLKKLFAWFPIIMWMHRCQIFLQNELRIVGFVYYNVVGPIFQRFMQWQMGALLKKRGRKDLISKVVPNYPPGCKRITISENYLETLSQDNVHVIRENIVEVDGNKLTTSTGETHEVDIVVLATGYKVQEFLGPFDAYGRNSTSLKSLWRGEFPDTFHGISAAGFPNMFFLLGPNTGLGHNSVVTMIEIQTQYAVQCIEYMMKKNIASLEVKKDVQEKWVKHLQKDLKQTVWAGRCDSWYMNAAGHVTALWSGSVTSYWLNTRKPNISAYNAVGYIDKKHSL